MPDPDPTTPTTPAAGPSAGPSSASDASPASPAAPTGPAGVPSAPSTPSAPPTAGAADGTAPTSGTAAAPAADPRAASLETRRWKARFQAKVAGFLLLLLGAFIAVQFGSAGFLVGSDRAAYDTVPGGVLQVDAPQHPGATAAFVCACDETSTVVLDAEGQGDLPAGRGVGRLELREGNTTVWSQPAFAPAGQSLPAPVRDTSAGSSESYIGAPDPGVVRTAFLAIAAFGIVLVVGGWCAFKLRGPRVAMAATLLLFVAGIALALATGVFMAWTLAATGGVASWFVYRARDQFAPLRRPRATA